MSDKRNAAVMNRTSLRNKVRGHQGTARDNRGVLRITIDKDCCAPVQNKCVHLNCACFGRPLNVHRPTPPKCQNR
jgi:hypothetical protein